MARGVDLEGRIEVTGGSHSPEEIRAEMERILHSAAVKLPERSRKFLRYVVGETLEGRAASLKEYSIGVEAFDRDETFDPRLDNVVRTEARKLRALLSEYYATEGKLDPLRIELPKGHYAPLISSLEPPDSTTLEAPPAQVDPHRVNKLPLDTDAFAKHPVGENLTPRRAYPRALILLAVCLIGIVSVYLVRFALREQASRGQVPSIVVLPFTNVSGDKADDPFTDGLTEELIDSLTRVPKLQVVARTSAFQYRNSTLDIRKIGKDLNVRTALEGTVRKSGDRIRITAELDDTTNGYSLWSQSFDVDQKDALVIQREISIAITHALGVTLAKGGTKSADAASPRPAELSPSAHQDYLKGLFFASKSTAEGARLSVGYFEQAIAKQPDYALAYEGLAQAYIGLVSLANISPGDVKGKITSMAMKALSLDNSLGEAHFDLARAYMYDFDWQSADSEYRKGLEMTPGSARGHSGYTIFLLKVGRLTEALEHGQKALELDPVSSSKGHSVAKSLYYLRRYQDVIDQARKTLALDPNFAFTHRDLGLAYLQLGRCSDAISGLESASPLFKGTAFVSSELGYAYAKCGKPDEARQILSRLLDLAKRAPVPSVDIAQIYIGLGEKDRAFEWLSKAMDERDSNVYLKSDPLYDSLRSDPRFAALLQRMRLG